MPVFVRCPFYRTLLSSAHETFCETWDRKRKGRTKMDMDRRGFLQGAVVSSMAVAASGLFGCSAGTSAAASEDAATSLSSWRDKPAAPTDIATTEKADIVIIGAGNAGLSAAASALDAGASVIVLETGKEVQDSRSWIGAVDSKLQKQAGIVIDHDEATAEICRMASYMSDERLVHKWADDSGEFMDWFIGVMETQDLHVMLETACKDSIYYNKAVAHHVYKGSYNPSGEGNSFYHHTLALKAYITGKNGDIRFGTRAQMLVQDVSGKVTGVIAKADDGSYIRFDAKNGVIVATGGYGNNEEMLEDLTMTAHRYCCMNIGADRNLGDGVRMLVWAGAHLHPVQETMVFDRGTMATGAVLGFPFGGGLWYGGTQPFLRVNMAGERFFDEDQTYDYNFNAAVAQPGHTWWQVFDKNYYSDCERFQTSRCSRVAAPVQGQAPMTSYLDGATKLDASFLQAQLDQVMQSGAAVKADSIDALAKQMGVPSSTFGATIDRYNALWDQQDDSDFGKKAFRLSAIKEGPFYAVHCAGWLLCTLGGVSVNQGLQPVDDNGTPIEGVYVIGNDQGGFYSTVYPETFGGLNNGKGMTFGYLVGKALAQA